jgi:hypothetical protein
MSISFYANISSTISHEWTGFPRCPNHENIDEVPGAPNGVPFTIDYKNYNSDQRDTLDVYGVSFVPIPENAANVKMQIGMRMRTKHHFGWFYAHVSLYNGFDHWYTIRKILDPHQWQAAHSNVIEHWSAYDINPITQIKLKADTNPIEVAALYLYIQYELGVGIKYGTGLRYGAGWKYGYTVV